MKTLGKIAGGLGLQLVLTSWLPFLASSSVTALLVQLGLGAVLLIVWAMTNTERLTTWTRSVFFYGSSAVFALIFLALIVAANVIAAKRAKSWDLTNRKINSLSLQTRELLADLKEPVRALVFNRGGPPPDSVDSLFAKYAEQTDKFTWTAVDPQKAVDLVTKYQIKDGPAVAVLVKNDGTPNESHTTASLGALANGEQGEQELTNALIRLNNVGQQKVYFIIGHGEALLDAPRPDPREPVNENTPLSLAQVKNSLIGDGYTPESLDLREKNAIPTDASAVFVVGPRTPFAARERQLLDEYLGKGGRVLFFADSRADSGLDPLLARYGVQIDNGIITDPQLNPEQPYIVPAPSFGEHVIVNALRQAHVALQLVTARALTVLREGLDPGVTATVLVTTSQYSWIETTPSTNPQLDPGEKAGKLPVVIASTRPIDAAGKITDEARLITFGDAHMLTVVWGYEPNRNMVLNSLAWAANQPKRITIRPPDRETSTIDIDEPRLASIRLVVMAILPTLLTGIGLTIWLTRRAR